MVASCDIRALLTAALISLAHKLKIVKKTTERAKKKFLDLWNL